MYTKSKATINTILEAARTQFIEKNYADVTILDIATRADASKGALYHHFSSKEDLYLKMMHHYLTEIQSVIEVVAENNTGAYRDRLYQSVLVFLKLPHELHSILSLVRRDINIFRDPMRNELIRAYQSAIPEQVEAILRDGLVSGEIQPFDARLLSWQLVALVEVALQPYSRRVMGEPEAVAESVIHLFLDGSATHRA
ncbi:MAG: TetR/AcrR family transcriptional regulator [Chloroflexota bacterium]